MNRNEKCLAILSHPTLKRSNVRFLLASSWDSASEVFYKIQSKSKRVLPNDRILTSEFLEFTGIKKSDFADSTTAKSLTDPEEIVAQKKGRRK